MDKERELQTWCELIFQYTKERVENDSIATRWIFDRATHDEWVLSLFPKHLASEKAYQQFFDLTGKDIREFNWNSKVRTKSGRNIIVHQYFVDEHMTTAHDFKYELIYLYKQGNLTVEKIKELISLQRLCWITKEENDMLNQAGFRNHRSNPYEAYMACGIEIYDKQNSDLNVMISTFNKQENSKFGQSSNEILQKLQTYFNDNKINGKSFKLCSVAGGSYAWIYRKNDYMINVRVKRGFLKDISLYISGDDAKKKFEILKTVKNELESLLGYKLAWDENKGKKATRIGRFFKDAELDTDFEIKNKEICFDFNVGDFDYVEKVAEELVSFYNVFSSIFEKEAKNYVKERFNPNKKSRFKTFFEEEDLD